MNAWMRWGLYILGALVAAALIGAGVLAYLVSRIDVRAEVERAVEGATGRDLTISGNVGVSYWPTIGVHAAGASLANVAGGRAPSFMTADDIHVGVELQPLLNRQVVVRRLVFQQPRIALEVDADGRPNWILAPASRPPGPTPQPPTRPSEPLVDVARTSLREIQIDNGEISFFDARRGAGWQVGDVDLRSALTSLDAPMRAEGSVRYNDRPVEIAVEVGRPSAAMRGQAVSLKFDIDSELVTAAFNGQTVAASGELAGAVQASGSSLRQLTAWAGAPIQGGVGLENYQVAGRLAIGGGRYDFSNASFTLDRVSGRGDFVLSQLRGKPYLSGRLEVFDFDLNPYISGEAPTAVVEAPPSANTPPTPTAELAATEAAPRAVDVQEASSETPIDFSGLRAFNADLELVIHAVLVQHMRIDAGRLNLVLNDGYLAATLHNLSLYGGSGRGRFEIDAREPATRMLQDLAFDGIAARPFLTDAVNFSNIEGRGEVTLQLRTQGRTQEEMIASADGRLHMEVVSGTLHGVDLGGVASTIRNALRGELIAPEARTSFTGFSATFSMADGVLASDDLSFNTPDLRIPGLGVIDLNARRLDARLAPRSPRGGVVVPFSIRGPWGQFTYAGDTNDRVLRELQPRVAQLKTASRAVIEN
jgi:AsmA protein